MLSWSTVCSSPVYLHTVMFADRLHKPKLKAAWAPCVTKGSSLRCSLKQTWLVLMLHVRKTDEPPFELLNTSMWSKNCFTFKLVDLSRIDSQTMCDCTQLQQTQWAHIITVWSYRVWPSSHTFYLLFSVVWPVLSVVSPVHKHAY